MCGYRIFSVKQIENVTLFLRNNYFFLLKLGENPLFFNLIDS